MGKLKLPPMAVMVGNILDTYDRASDAQLSEGIVWYDKARVFAKGLANRGNLTLYQAAGIIAALSPQQAWGANQKAAETFVRDYGMWGILPALHTRVQLCKCADIWHSDGSYESVALCLKGPKESAFYANIAGNLHIVTVDRWAYRTAVGESLKQGRGLGKGAYRALSEAFTIAARQIGVKVAVLQAIVWCVERGGGA